MGTSVETVVVVSSSVVVGVVEVSAVAVILVVVSLGVFTSTVKVVGSSVGREVPVVIELSVVVSSGVVISTAVSVGIVCSVVGSVLSVGVSSVGKISFNHCAMTSIFPEAIHSKLMLEISRTLATVS